MGWKKLSGSIYSSEDKMFGTEIDTVWFVGDMKFHQSFDWIMPVIEKIEEKKAGVIIKSQWNEFNLRSFYQVSISIEEGEMSKDRKCIYNSRSIYRKNTDGDTKIEAIYKAVIEFIKWYNQTKS